MGRNGTHPTRLKSVNPAPKSSARTATGPASSAYAEAFVPEPDGAAAARGRADDLGLECISPGVAAALALLARVLEARAVVEIGTGTGASALALLAGMAADGVLTSIDAEAEHQLAAREVLTAEGIPSRRVRLIAGQALAVLPKLTDGAYDIVYVDGDPLEYVEYVAQAQRLLRRGGLIVLHHALWQGLVADERNDDDEPLIIREALQAVLADESFTPVLLPLGDGLLVAVRS